MLISHTHKFIYTKTIKTASTSVEAYFERFCMPNDTLEHITDSRDEYISDTGIIGYRGAPPYEAKKRFLWYNHKPAVDIKQDIGDDIWNNYYKFCVIRNPYERAISLFYWYMAYIIRVPFSNNLDTDRLEFSKFLNTDNAFITDHLMYSIDGKFCLDDVIRHEQLDDDMKRVCDILKIDWVPEAMPKFKSGVTPKFATVQDMYTNEAKAVIARVCAFELDCFDYKFD
jgi:hypothetical protein